MHEIMLINEQLQQSIYGGCSMAELEEIINESGMLTIKQDGIAKAMAGLVEIGEVMKATEMGE